MHMYDGLAPSVRRNIVIAAIVRKDMTRHDLALLLQQHGAR